MMDRGQVGILVLLALCGCTRTELPLGDRVVLQHATVIDGTGAGPRDDVTIVIQGGRIESIESGNGDRSLVADRVIDLRGRWVVPGFIDMHTHMMTGPRQAGFLKALIVSGITTARSTAATPESGVELRDRLSSGELLGPRFFTAGRLIDGPGSVHASDIAVEVSTEEQIREEVRHQAAEGVDFIKLYVGLTPDLVEAAVDEAHQLDLKVIGHLGRTTWLEALDLGIDALTHSWYAGLAHSISPPDLPELEQLFIPNADFRAEHLGIWNDVVDLQGPQMDQLVADVVSRRVVLDPNLVLGEAVTWGDDRALFERLEAHLDPTGQPFPHPYSLGWSAEAREAARLAFPTFLEAIRILHERGALITTGTDLLNPWMTPGVSFHRELELLVQAGISPLDVLSIGTRNGAEGLGVLDEVGTIEPGKIADLVVLRADPLASISNTRLIDLVIQRGEVLQPDTLISN